MTTTTTTNNNNNNNNNQSKVEDALDLCHQANDLLSKLVDNYRGGVEEEETECGGDHDHNHKQSIEEEIQEEQEQEQEESKQQSNSDQQQQEEKILQSSISLFKQALLLDGNCVDALIGLSYIAGLQCNHQESSNLLDMAEKIAPEDVRVKTMRDALVEKVVDEDEDQQESEGQDPDLTDLKTGHNSLNIPHLIVNGFVTKKFIVTLREIFDRFDTKRFNSWSLKDMQGYTMVVNQIQLDRATYQSLIRTYNSDKNGLTFTGFVELYINQTIEDPKETLKDLAQLGYDSQLQRL